jgi:hypothetical protein
MLRIEAALIFVALLTAWIHPRLGSTWFENIERRFSVLARRRMVSVLLVGGLALGLRVAVLPIEPIPEPIDHDEFGYLLAADTFAHGRLTNPTPPMWEHFETFHVMFHPTYASIYPPAQGFFLAIGKVVFGQPFWGVWLSVGFMCAAITWMLQGWMAPEWALLGGCIAVLRYGVFGYWADSYWGGAVGALGGAIVLGALPRIKQSQRLRDAILLGIGLSILANSRPYEGFLFSIPIALLLFAWTVGKKSPQLVATIQRVVVPLALMLALTAAGTGYYLFRLTGSPVRMPYQIERQTYAVAPYMIWQPIRLEPVYHHAAMRKMFVEEEIRGLKTFRSGVGLLFRAFLAWSFFLGPVLTLPFLMLALTSPPNVSFRTVHENTLAAILVLVVFSGGSLLVNFYSPHYSAPATGLILLLLMVAARQLRGWGRSGLFLARAVPVICLMSFCLRAAAKPLHVPLGQYYEFNWYQENGPTFGRAAIQERLLHIPGNHLVIVHYRPEHEPFAEWVYNQADIQNARVIWARDMGQVENEQMGSAWGNRKIWLLDADAKPPRVSELELPNSSATSPAVKPAWVDSSAGVGVPKDDLRTGKERSKRQP